MVSGLSEAGMIRSGEEATSWGDELTGMQHTLQGFTGAFVGVDEAFGDGSCVHGGATFLQHKEDAIALDGTEEGAERLGVGAAVVLLAEPDKGGDGLLVLHESDQCAGLRTEALAGAQLLLLGVGRVFVQVQVTAGESAEQVAGAGVS